jgi:RIO-like serine/threonine protein kinase
MAQCNVQESFSDPNTYKTLSSRFWGPRPLKGNDPKDFLVVCLKGQPYTIIGRLGSGDESVVFEIVDSSGKHLALKYYTDEFAGQYQSGDILAMAKANASREFLNIPLVVNRENHYSIYPILEGGTIARNKTELRKNAKKYEEMNGFSDKLEAALERDGLRIGDTENPQNYMYDKNGRLWRIDLGQLVEIKK